MKDFRFIPEWAVAFRASPFRIRFELGGEVFDRKAPVPRFVQAFGRARQVAFDALRDSMQVFAVVGCWLDDTNGSFVPGHGKFEALNYLGFDVPMIEEWDGPHPLWGDVSDEDMRPAKWRSYDITNRLSDRDVIIWCAIAYEMDIHPKALVTPFIVDMERKILVHIYDDRGMDVIALNRDTLLEVYERHDEWILDYDRVRISKAFSID